MTAEKDIQGETLRAMTASDLEAVASLARRADPFGWTLRNFQDALASGYPMTVLEVGGVIAGYCVVMIVIDEAELLEIAVDPPMQGAGRGKTLLAAALAAAREGAARLMHLEVRESNARARKMYRSAGFSEVGRRRGYYPTAEGREDAVLMTKDLQALPAQQD